MSKFRSVSLAVAVMATMAATPTQAAVQSVSAAQVTLIEPTYMPSFIAFQIDKAVGACPAGSFLRWYAQGADAATKSANVTAIYSALVTAMASGKTVNLGVDDSNCNVGIFQINR